MTTRSEKEKQKAQQEKYQAILSNLLKDDDNKYCVDCDAKGPRWASWNLGIFLCIRCAGIHRNLGVHISKVKSVNLDTWTPEQVAMMMEIGNSRARAAYEANLPDNYRRPQADSALESFVRAKYEHKKYLAKEWVQPKPVVPKELQFQLLEDEKDKKRSKPKPTGNISLSAVPRSQTASSAASSQSTVSSTSKPSNPKPVAQATPVTAPKQPAAPAVSRPNNSSNTVDLIGLDAPSVTGTGSSNSLLDDFMGGGTAAPSSQPVNQPDNTQVSNGGLEASLFADSTAATDKQANVSTKDSIMALYGGQQQSQTQFGVPGGVYMPQQQQAMASGMYGMQQQQPQQMTQQMPVQQVQQQQGMYANQMAMMGMQQGNMGMPQGNIGMAQGNMGMAQGNIGMAAPQVGVAMPQQTGMPQAGMPVYANQQQMQFNQMNSQMSGMNLGQQQNGMGWGTAQNSGHTLSTNLWQ